MNIKMNNKSNSDFCEIAGTRIVYERNFLMQLKNSPMAKTPPKNIQYIPGKLYTHICIYKINVF